MRNARTPLAVGLSLVVAVPATVLVTRLLERRCRPVRTPLAGRPAPTWSPAAVPPEHPHALT
ncbi:MAG: hypothetical protein ACTHMQ_06095 [Protaetiibacter sp.]